MTKSAYRLGVIILHGIGWWLLGVDVGYAQDEVRVNTRYHSKTDLFITRGSVEVDVPINDLARVAGELEQYGSWSLRNINIRPDGDKYIILLRDVRHVPGRPHGLGHFIVRFDIDVVWPFGSKNNVIKFGVKKATPRPGGGISELEVELYGQNRLIKQFYVLLLGSGTETKSSVHFLSRVELAGWVDPFFPLSVYRKNIEKRIVRVISNLRLHLENTSK